MARTCSAVPSRESSSTKTASHSVPASTPSRRAISGSTLPRSLNVGRTTVSSTGPTSRRARISSISSRVVAKPTMPQPLLAPDLASPRHGDKQNWRPIDVWATAAIAHREILRLRMRHDDRRGRLLRIELVLLGEHDADLVGAQQREKLFLVAEIGAGRIAEGIAAAAIALVEHGVEIARLLAGEAELAADALVQVFRHRLGHLDRKPVKIEVVLIAVLGEPFARHLGGAVAHGDDLQADDVALAVADVAEEIGDAQTAILVLARERQPREHRRSVDVVDDDVVAFGGAFPIAVGRLRNHDVLLDGDVEHALEDGAQLLMRPCLVLIERAALFAVAPLELIEHALVEKRHERLDRHAGDRPRPPEGRLRHRHLRRQLGTAQADLLEIERAQRPRIGGTAELALLVDDAAGVLGAQHRQMLVETLVDDLDHDVEPVEGVARIDDPAAAVGFDAILFDVTAGQRGAAEHDRDVETLARHLFEVLAHDHGRFDQQPRHADDVGLVLDRSLQDRGDRLLDAEIDDLVAVVGEDDVDEVLADVVDVAAHRRQHDRALLLSLDALHEGLEVIHRRLHRFGRLQHEGKLHLAGAEQLADHLHAIEQEAVDDVERLVGLHRFGKIVLEAEPVAIDDALRQAFLDFFG